MFWMSESGTVLYCFTNIDYLELVLGAEADEDELCVTHLCWKNTWDLSSTDLDSAVLVGPFGIRSIPIWYSMPNSVFFGHFKLPVAADVSLAWPVVAGVSLALWHLASSTFQGSYSMAWWTSLISSSSLESCNEGHNYQNISEMYM